MDGSMKKAPAVHIRGLVSLVHNKHQRHNSKIYSCGSGDDNSIAVWDFKDDDFHDSKKVITLKDQCTSAIACYNDDIYVGVIGKNSRGMSQHLLRKYTLANDNSTTDLQIAIFNEKITAVDVSSDGKYLVAGSRDHTCKGLTFDMDSSKFNAAKDHSVNGAVVFISIDPTSEYYVVSASDGRVILYALEDFAYSEQLQAVAYFDACKPFNPEDGLARLQTCWNADGSKLFIPSDGCINVITNNGWHSVEKVTFGMSAPTLFTSVICGRDSLISMTDKDKVICFDLSSDEAKPVHEKDIHIDSLQDPGKGHLVSSVAFIDDGYLAVAARTGDVYTYKYETSPIMSNIVDEDEGDVGKLKEQYGFSSRPVETTSAYAFDPTPVVPSKPAILIDKARVREILVPGSAFQSNDFSCFKWNAYGYVFSRVVDGERSIEVKFHDASVHSEIIMDNQTTRFTLADLNNSILALASQDNDKHESELYVQQFGGWDRDNQFWSSTMQNGERIDTLAVGQDFVAVYTDLRFIRIYSATGIARLVFSSTGPLRSLIAGGRSLCLVRDTGGLIVEENDEFYEHQYVMDLYTVSPLSSRVLVPQQKAVALPLSPESDLNWISFTPSGNLCTMDSLFVVRYLAPGDLWIPIFIGANSLKDVAGDAIWPISLTDRQSPKFRYIYCRGRTIPDFQKTAVPVAAEWDIPIENKETEKGKYEHELLLNEVAQRIASGSGFPAEEQKSLAVEYSKLLTKLFALCCKKEQDARALDIASLSSDQKHLQIMCNFAAKQGRSTLSNKISALGQERAEQSNAATTQNIYVPESYGESSAAIRQPVGERKVQLQKRRQQSAAIPSSFTPVNTSVRTIDDSISVTLTPDRLGTVLNTVENTQASVASIASVTSNVEGSNRKRSIVTNDNGKSAKVQRNDDDFFDSLM